MVQVKCNQKSCLNLQITLTYPCYSRCQCLVYRKSTVICHIQILKNPEFFKFSPNILVLFFFSLGSLFPAFWILFSRDKFHENLPVLLVWIDNLEYCFSF